MLIFFLLHAQNGRSSLGEALYRTITSESFSPDALIATIDSTHEHNVLELVNCVEAAIHIWRRKLQTRQTQSTKDGKGGSKSSWGLAKDGAIDLEKREMLAEKAEGLLLLLRHKFPGLPQTILDMNKIQYNKVPIHIYCSLIFFFWVQICVGCLAYHLFFISRMWVNQS